MVAPVVAQARFRLVAVTTQVQEAFPEASEVRNFPTHGEPFLNLRDPTTSRLAVGDIVPIHTFPHHAITLLF